MTARGASTMAAPTRGGLAALLATVLALLATTGAPAWSQDHLDPATGFRISNYRAPTPSTVPGGTVITLEQLEQKEKGGAVLIDVGPAEGASPDPETGVWRLSKPHVNRPGSAWLPGVGKGSLSPSEDAYFRRNLQRLTGGNLGRPIVIYCQADCWMSWNAVKRASGYGYTQLAWYPEGTDGMRDWDQPLAPATPVPFQKTR